MVTRRFSADTGRGQPAPIADLRVRLIEPPLALDHRHVGPRGSWHYHFYE
jgi:hypothetical protein